MNQLKGREGNTEAVPSQNEAHDPLGSLTLNLYILNLRLRRLLMADLDSHCRPLSSLANTTLLIVLQIYLQHTCPLVPRYLCASVRQTLVRRVK